MTAATSHAFKFITVYRLKTPVLLCRDIVNDKLYVNDYSVQSLLKTLQKETTDDEYRLVPNWERDLAPLVLSKFPLTKAMRIDQVGDVFARFCEQAVKIRDGLHTTIEGLSGIDTEEARLDRRKYTAVFGKVSSIADKLLTIEALFKMEYANFNSLTYEYKQNEALLERVDDLITLVYDCESVADFKKQIDKRLEKLEKKFEAIDSMENVSTLTEDELHSQNWVYRRAIYAAEHFETRKEVANYLYQVIADLRKYGELVTVEV